MTEDKVQYLIVGGKSYLQFATNTKMMDQFASYKDEVGTCEKI